SIGSSLSVALTLLAITLAVLLAAHALASSTSMRQLRWVVAGAGILTAVFGLWSLISAISYRSKILDIPKQLEEITGSLKIGIPEIDEYFKLGIGPWLYFICLLAIAVVAVMPVLIKSPQEKWEAYQRKMAMQQGGYAPQMGQPGMQQYGSYNVQGQPMQQPQSQMPQQGQGQMPQVQPFQPMQQPNPTQPGQQPPTYWQP
ncbi:MAG: hypothetical protein ACRCWS_07765, partial [Propionibacteriaceae bacterium]